MTGLSPILEVVWQQPPETPVHHHKLDNKRNNSAGNTNQSTQEFQNKQITEVTCQ